MLNNAICVKEQFNDFVSSMWFSKTFHWFNIMFVSPFIFATVPPPTQQSHNLLDGANPRSFAMSEFSLFL
jgi:hypothetical protein